MARTARLPLLLLLLAALALPLSGCGGDDEEETSDDATTEATTEASAGDGSTLSGTVGPGFDISLDGTDGLMAGDYTLTVEDLSSSHNFHLTGPGDVDVSTSVGDEGEESFEVTLEPGEYTFVCDPHASQMRGTFTVG
jgi:Copper binding proteins, plastocyanin/azurin family